MTRKPRTLEVEVLEGRSLPSSFSLTGAGDAPLETMGMTSVAMIELVYAVEDRFSITIADDEVAPDNFASIGSLVKLVTRKCPS